MSTNGNWQEALGKDNRGSRPRCIELVSGTKEEVASRITDIVGLEEVKVASDDFWMPRGIPVWNGGLWDKSPAREARFDRDSHRFFRSPAIRNALLEWWLEVIPRSNTPNWDIASTCMIEEQRGILLVEAKAHFNELSISGKSQPSTENGWKNHERIGWAIEEANTALGILTNRHWGLSRDDRYQLSNRFAWTWKLASLEIPVVLVYLGFLNAEDMVSDGALFRTENDWNQAVFSHAAGVVDYTIWENCIDTSGSPFSPIIRAVEVPI